MLVLSRRSNDSIYFPELDITIEVLRINGASVRVGIEAPIEVSILRGELAKERKEVKQLVINGENEHQVRNQLNLLAIASATANRHLAKGDVNLAASALSSVLSRLEEAGEKKPTIESPSTALLIEDMTNEREMMAGFLRLNGFEVSTAKDGIEAIEYLEENEKPDFLLMDMNLPRLDGASAIRKIRANPAFDLVKIFAVSGQSAEQAKIDVNKNRIAAWFQKPIHPANFISSIENYMSAATVS
jgi:carbon storage regulator CsrA